jgi:hypothetical protein
MSDDIIVSELRAQTQQGRLRWRPVTRVPHGWVSYVCYEAQSALGRVQVGKMTRDNYDDSGRAVHRVSYFVELPPAGRSLRPANEDVLRALWEEASRTG